MRATAITSALLIAATSAFGQIHQNTTTSTAATPSSLRAISDELEAMYEKDQLLRREIPAIQKQYGRNSPQIREIGLRMSETDRTNMRRLKEIIAEFGWPEKTKFGAKAASAAFFILQHSDLATQKKYLPMAKAAAEKGEMNAGSLAMLEDRILLREGKEQIYGSQVTMNASGEWEPRPIADEQNVDALRTKVGLGPIAEYLQGFADRSGGRVSPKWASKMPNKSPEPTPTAVTSRAN